MDTMALYIPTTLTMPDIPTINFDVERFLNTSHSINNNGKSVATPPVLNGTSFFFTTADLMWEDMEMEEVSIFNQSGIDIAEVSLFSSNVEVNQERTSFYPPSPTSSLISSEEMEDFPATIEDLESWEIKPEEVEEITTVILPVVNADDVEEENVFECDEDFIPEEQKKKLITTKSGRVRRRPRNYSPDVSDSDSDPDFDPSEYGGKKRESDKPLKRCQLIKSEPLEPTSDYLSEELESEEDDEEKPQKARKPSGSRRPSQNPIPQQRKKGSTQKISQWMVTLLRSPATNPSILTWEDESRGKFRVMNSTAFAELWGKVKKNPGMNYEKLSRAIRYYYKNKEIEVVKGERLVYAFGSNMRDFRAKDPKDPNFKKQK